MGIRLAGTGVDEPVILDGGLGRLEAVRGDGLGAQLLQQRIVDGLKGILEVLGQFRSRNLNKLIKIN